MRDDEPEYVVLRRRPPRRAGLILVGAVGILGFVAGLASGLGFILALVLGFMAAGVVAAARGRRGRRRDWRDRYDEEGW